MNNDQIKHMVDELGNHGFIQFTGFDGIESSAFSCRGSSQDVIKLLSRFAATSMAVISECVKHIADINGVDQSALLADFWAQVNSKPHDITKDDHFSMTSKRIPE